MQEESLHEMHAEVAHRHEFLGAFDTLRDDHRAVVVRELHHRFHQILFDEVRVDRIDERDVQLDEVWLEVRDRAKAGVAAAGVVYCKAVTHLSEHQEPLPEFRIVFDCRAFRDLEHDPLRMRDFVFAE